ncbi:MAG TPA: amidase family protein, partial [Novosphingobium sp.]|nr:amidase family protein [Novosphingobium sp.]
MAGASPLDTQDALGLAGLVRRGEVAPLELLEEAIGRAEALDPQFHFLAQRHYDYGRAAIARGLPQGPFTGVPWLLKDLNTHIAGLPSEGGSRFYQGQLAAETSELVRRIERAGFVVFGKTTTPEFGLSGTTENRLTGATRNPWNPAHIAGGSSGGAAVAVAAGVLPAAHATDGGGSIRIPAACCGLFGLKPSRGRVPMGPPRSEGWGGLATHHAITRSVRDSAAILDATWGAEPGARYAAPTPERPFLAEVTRPPRALRIALMTAPFAGSPVAAPCVAATRAAAALCERLGHHVEEAAPAIDGAALGEISLSPGVGMDVWGQRAGAFAAFTGIANMTGQPAMSLPLAMSDGGLPIGVQVL